MDFKNLDYIYAIAKYKNISEAAKHLYISQPSLSVFLKKTEEKIGYKLFERMNKQMQLTEVGEKYIKAIERIYRIKDDFYSSINYKPEVFSVGATVARSKYIIPQAFGAFKKKYPQISIKSYELNYEDLEKYLDREQIDLSMYLCTEKNEKLCNHIIRQEEIILCTSSHNPIRNKMISKKGFNYPWIDSKYILDETFLILPSEFIVGKFARKFFENNNCNPKTIDFTNVETSIEAACSGLGTCFCSDITVKHFKTNHEALFFTTGEKPTRYEFVISHKKEKKLNKKLLEFIEIVKNI